jgi:hypothetical protein
MPENLPRMDPARQALLDRNPEYRETMAKLRLARTKLVEVAKEVTDYEAAIVKAQKELEAAIAASVETKRELLQRLRQPHETWVSSQTALQGIVAGLEDRIHDLELSVKSEVEMRDLLIEAEQARLREASAEALRVEVRNKNLVP